MTWWSRCVELDGLARGSTMCTQTFERAARREVAKGAKKDIQSSAQESGSQEQA